MLPRQFRRALIGAAFMVFLSRPATAQWSTWSWISAMGLEAGINRANIGGDIYPGTKARSAISAGGFLRFELHRLLTLEPHLTYSQQGFGYPDNINPDVTLRLDYVLAAFLLRYSPTKTKPIHPFLIVGPAYGIKINCYAPDAADISRSCSSLGYDVKEHDLTGMIGAGIQVRTFNLSIRLNKSLGSIENRSGISWKNQVLTIMVGKHFKAESTSPFRNSTEE